MARNNRGDVALTQGELAVAETQFRLSLGLLRSLDDVANVSRALYNLGAVALERKRPDEAVTLLVDALELSQRIADDEDTAWCLIGLAAVAETAGRASEGARLIGFARGLLDRLEATMKPFEQRLSDRTETSLLASLGRDGLEEERAKGEATSMDEILELARSLAPARAADPSK
jgi:tetratricopeptide (TPR) repeat protein